MGDPTPATRRIVYDRDGHECVSSILPGRCGGPLELGHIVNRGMGGSDRHDTPGWLIAQCHDHNQACETNVEVMRAARALGHKLRGQGLLPERALVHYPDGIAYWLNDDGTKERFDDPWSVRHAEP